VPPTPTYTPVPPTATPTPYIDKSPPKINDFSWQPLRVVNDKVHDGRVSFVAENSYSPIAEAELNFIPVKYDYLPLEAFPREEAKTFVLEPLDGAFDELKEEFTVDVKDIIGGREYVVEAVVKDREGNVGVEKIKTPYIREFENIAPLDDVIVITPYYVWYRKDLSNWYDGHKYMPLLGRYKSNDPIVISKHIDWATGHGIDVFAVSWTGYEEGDLKYFDNNLKLLFNNTLFDDISIVILYESHGRLRHTGNPRAPWEIDLSDEWNISRLIHDLRYLAKTYFNEDTYFRLNGVPVVYLWDSAAFIGNVKGTMQKVRNEIKSGYGHEIFIISDHVKPFTDTFPRNNREWVRRAEAFDGVTSWLGGYMPNGEYLGGSYEKQLDLIYEAWLKWTYEKEKLLIPYLTPEFDSRYVIWGDPNSVPLHYSPQLFEQRLKISSKYTNGGIIFVGTMNDFFESTVLEPTVEHGFERLHILLNVLKSHQ
jgi:hypothetical protein